MNTYGIALQFSIGANIEKTARSIVGTSTKGVSVGEELDGVDVRVVSGEGLNTLLLSNVPKLCEGVAGTRNELIVVERVNAQAHNIAEMVGEFLQLLASLDIPEHTGHVTRRCQDAAVVDEATAREVSRVTRQFSGNTSGTVAGGQVVDRTDVVQTTTSDVVAAGSVGTSHDPRGSERDGVDLVCAVGVPDDELTVLRSRDEMPSVSRPVHGVDLCEMALESALGLHLEAGKSLCALASDIADCGRGLEELEREN